VLSGYRHHDMARPRVADGGDCLQMWRIAAESRQGVILQLGCWTES